MALIGSITSLRVEDFPGQNSWIGKLLFPLNQALSAFTNALNGNITYGDNIPCQTISLRFTYGGTTDFPKPIKWQYMATPVELRVCSATEDETAIGVLPIWYFSNGQIYISNIVKVGTGAVSTLASGSVYNIVLRAQP